MAKMIIIENSMKKNIIKIYYKKKIINLELSQKMMFQ